MILSVMSGKGGTGKSTLSALIGKIAANRGKKVLLIDLDLGKPALHKLLEVTVKHGVEEALRGEITLEETIYHHERTKLDCVFTKQAVANRLELLESPILEKWIKECKKE